MKKFVCLVLAMAMCLGSISALADVEGQIQGEFTFFAQAINSEDLELAKSVGEGLLNLIDSRNKKCKMIK